MTIPDCLLRGAGLVLLLVPVAACAKPVDQANGAPGHATSTTGVTLQTYVQRHKGKLMADDTDGDGKVSRDEFLSAAKAGKVDPTKRFAKMDRNGDGFLDKAEIDAVLTRRFHRIDTNGDGVISADERAAAHARKGKVSDTGSDS